MRRNGSAVSSQVSDADTTLELLPIVEWQTRAPMVLVTADPASQHRNRKVLLVDDDSLILEISADILRDLGYQVHDMRSGEAALEALAGGLAVDLVISDRAMPDMSGTKLAALIRDAYPDLPILICTGDAGAPDIEAADLPTILKPYTADALSNCIDALFPRQDVAAAQISLAG